VLLNVVGILTKSISGFELWRFEFSILGLLWGNIYGVTKGSVSSCFFHVYPVGPTLTSASLNQIALQEFEQIEVKVPEKFISAIRDMRGTMFDFRYLGHQSRYTRYFTAIDSPPTYL